MLRLLCSAGLDELIHRGSANWIHLFIFLYLLHQLGMGLAILPGCCKLIGSSGHLILVTRLDNAFRWAGERSQEIRGGLTFGTFETHVGEEFFGLVDRAKIDLSTLVEDGHFVENLDSNRIIRQASPDNRHGITHIVSTLRSLVDSDTRRCANIVCG